MRLLINSLKCFPFITISRYTSNTIEIFHMNMYYLYCRVVFAEKFEIHF